MKPGESKKTSYECCGSYVYDEESDCYIYKVNLDKDEMGHFLRGIISACPYYQSSDGYRIVRRWMRQKAMNEEVIKT